VEHDVTTEKANDEVGDVREANAWPLVSLVFLAYNRR